MRINIYHCLIPLFFLAGYGATKAQFIDSVYLQKQWPASWIVVSNTPAGGYGVYYFRKKFDLPNLPKSFPVHVSADNRYKLFVNGQLVSMGPARGDLLHWNYETIDLIPFLHAGSNLIAAEVWNEGEFRQEANMSLRTGFILRGGNAEAQFVNTNSSWKGIRDSSYQPVQVRMSTYYVAGPGELVNMKASIRDWEKENLDDRGWTNASVLFPGSPKNIMGEYGTPAGWLLNPSLIPQMELTKQRLLKVRHSQGLKVPVSFPAAQNVLHFAPNSTATLILDQTFLTNAYVTLLFSGGRDASVSLEYAEALFTKYPSKGNRNETEGKIFFGRRDSIIPDGSAHQSFTSLTFRTYRYIIVRVTTKADSLIIDDLYGTFTGYPFRLNAKLETNDTELNKMLEIGWRTARLCAFETYTDCPYYEQLQYIGDARIQGLISLYNSGDDRLLLNALNLMDHSRSPEGITLSRHPSSTPQYINTFSLWYIGMLHDYMMYGKNEQFIKDKLEGERAVLNYFRKFQEADGSLKGVPYWTFTDWVDAPGWKAGRGPVGEKGNSSLLDLQLLWAYQLAADMENKIGMKEYAHLYNHYADQLAVTIRNKYWDEHKKLFSDRPEKDLYSQHANALAILTGLVGKEEVKDLGNRMLADTALAPASIYFKYYLHQSLVKAGLGNDYLHWLDKWRENIKMGLTTWAEISDINNARSDCHAWGASPNIEFFRTVLGIDSEAPGFTKIKIEPHLGNIQKIAGEIPHPGGSIAVRYVIINSQLNAEINLPDGTIGNFLWKGKTYSLKEGRNKLTVD